MDRYVQKIRVKVKKVKCRPRLTVSYKKEELLSRLTGSYKKERLLSRLTGSYKNELRTFLCCFCCCRRCQHFHLSRRGMVRVLVKINHGLKQMSGVSKSKSKRVRVRVRVRDFLCQQ